MGVLFVLLIPMNQRLIDQTFIGSDHLFDRRLVVLQMPLQNQGNLHHNKAGQNEAVSLQLGGVQNGQNALVFFPQEADALVHHQRQQVIADDDIQQILLLFPVGKIGGDDLCFRGVFRKFPAQIPDTGMELPADDGLHAAVLIREVIVEGFPGNAQLVAQVGNADGRVRPLQKIGEETFFDLPLTALGGCGTGILCIVHFSLRFGDKIQIYLQI